MKKVLLFLGSGVSLPLGLPNTDRITDAVLSDDNWNEFNDTALNGPALLQYLKRYADVYHSRKSGDIKSTTYEEIFYVLDQVLNEETRSHDNPAIKPFAKSLQKFIKCKVWPSMSGYSEVVKTTARTVSSYIRRVVAKEIVEKERKVRNDTLKANLELVINLANKVERLDIVTLNHDTMVEQLLDGQNIAFDDCFGQSDGDMRFYKCPRYSLTNSKAKVRFLKLHGSVDWYSLFVSSADAPTNQHLARAAPNLLRIRMTYQDAKSVQWSTKGDPILLVGTGNKANDYNSWAIVTDMWVHFHHIISENDLIIMSGYGWGDSEINAKLRRWVDSDNSNRLFFLHQEFDEKIRPRLTPQDSYRWLFPGQVQMRVIPKWLCEVKTVESLTDLMSQAIGGGD